MKKLTIMIDPELFWKLKEKAVSEKTTMTNLIVDAIKEIVKEDKDKCVK